jgi:hypothetical protein
MKERERPIHNKSALSFFTPALNPSVFTIVSNGSLASPYAPPHFSREKAGYSE